MNYFKNENHIIFRALTDEQKLLIISSKGRGYVDTPIAKLSSTWTQTNRHSIELDSVYRVAPKTMTEIEVMDNIATCTHYTLSNKNMASIKGVITDLFNRGITK